MEEWHLSEYEVPSRLVNDTRSGPSGLLIIVFLSLQCLFGDYVRHSFYVLIYALLWHNLEC